MHHNLGPLLFTSYAHLQSVCICKLFAFCHSIIIHILTQMSSKNIYNIFRKIFITSLAL